MEGIGQYVMGAAAVAVICALVLGLFPKKDGISGIIRMLCGAVMTLSLVSPFLGRRLEDLSGISCAMDREASAAVEQGEAMAQKELEEIIKSRCEAYILDKAKELGVQITVRITLDGQQIPAMAEIQGQLSPYAKGTLKRILEKDLGIGEANQRWM